MMDAAGRMQRLLVVVPNWVGDVVLATPTLRALREGLPAARITYLLRSYVAEVLAGAGWHDSLTFWPTAHGLREAAALVRLARQLRTGGFDTALLLTNSFKSALVCRLAGVPRRVGYARDGRGWLLTHKLQPVTEGGEFVPASVLPYYARLAEAVGCPVREQRPLLRTDAAQEAAGQRLMQAHGLTQRRFALINPGAAFGAAKCWPAERFAALCEGLERDFGLRPVLVGAAGELPLLRRIRTGAPGALLLENPGTTLGTLKVLARHAALLVCNDTGPRHYGNAYGVPTVTIFGPTHQAWTQTDYAGEVRLQLQVECGPCQLRTCPLDHRCMRGISVEMVLSAVRDVLARPRVAAG